MPAKGAVKSKSHEPDEVARLRSLAHDLSNSLEAILQAAYLLSQGRLDGDSKRWAQLIDSSSQEAARINRDMRKVLLALSETEAAITTKGTPRIRSGQAPVHEVKTNK